MNRPPIKCPNCRAKASPDHFRESPECAAVVRSLNGMVSLAARTTPPKPGPGRGKKGRFAERIERAPEQRKPQ